MPCLRESESVSDEKKFALIVLAKLLMVHKFPSFFSYVVLVSNSKRLTYWTRPRRGSGDRNQCVWKTNFKKLGLRVTLFDSQASCGLKYKGFRDRQPLFSLSCLSHLLTHTSTFFNFPFSTDPVSPILSSPCLCTVKIPVYIDIHREWPFLLVHTFLAAKHEVPHTPLSNCTIVQQRGVNIINGSHLEGKIMLWDFILLFSQASSIKSKWMAG